MCRSILCVSVCVLTKSKSSVDPQRMLFTKEASDTLTQILPLICFWRDRWDDRFGRGGSSFLLHQLMPRKSTVIHWQEHTKENNNMEMPPPKDPSKLRFHWTSMLAADRLLATQDMRSKFLQLCLCKRLTTKFDPKQYLKHFSLIWNLFKYFESSEIE